MVAMAVATFSVSNLNLISISARANRVKNNKNLGMKKSSIDDKQYLDDL